MRQSWSRRPLGGRLSPITLRPSFPAPTLLLRRERAPSNDPIETVDGIDLPGIEAQPFQVATFHQRSKTTAKTAFFVENSAGLLRQRLGQQRPRHQSLLDQDLAEPTARLSLVRQRSLKRSLGQHAMVDQQPPKRRTCHARRSHVLHSSRSTQPDPGHTLSGFGRTRNPPLQGLTTHVANGDSGRPKHARLLARTLARVRVRGPAGRVILPGRSPSGEPRFLQ